MLADAIEELPELGEGRAVRRYLVVLEEEESYELAGKVVVLDADESGRTAFRSVMIELDLALLGGGRCPPPDVELALGSRRGGGCARGSAFLDFPAGLGEEILDLDGLAGAAAFDSSEDEGD